MTYNIYLFKH